MDDLISRQAVIDMLAAMQGRCTSKAALIQNSKIWQQIKDLPSAQSERKRGKWTEKHHAYSDEESVIEEWQSCRCSECGRYDTRPYLYYFDEPNFCSWCGARMKGEEDGAD